MAIRNHFRALLFRKQQRENRRIPLQEVHRETGIAWSTLQRWDNDDVNRFDTHVLSTLCQYFNCMIGDLLEYEPDTLPEE